jgi:acyl carrier protein
MTDIATSRTIREIVAAVLEVDADTIADDTDFVLELGADSLSVIEVMARLEAVLNLRIDQSQLARMTSVAAICEIVTDSAMALAA